MKSRRSLIAVIVIILLAVGLICLRLYRPAPGPKPDQPGGTNGTQANDPTRLPETKLVFKPATFRVKRRYDQRRWVDLTNGGSKPVEVRVAATSPTDLPCGFVGRGTPDWHVENTTLRLLPGETWTIPFLIHANSPRALHYDVPVTALTAQGDGWKEAAKGTVAIDVEAPTLILQVSWADAPSPIDRARLVQVMTVKNVGDPIADLNVSLTPDLKRGKLLPGSSIGRDLKNRIYFGTVIEDTVLPKNQELQVRVWPRLYPGMKEVAGTIYLEGNGHILAVPYRQEVPTGKKVFVVASRTCSHCRNDGTRCTNCGSASFSMTPPPGSDTPDSHGHGHGGGRSGTMTTLEPLSDDDMHGNDDDHDDEDDEDDDDEEETPHGYESLGRDPEDFVADDAAEDDNPLVDNLDDNTTDVTEGERPPTSDGEPPADVDDFEDIPFEDDDDDDKPDKPRKPLINLPLGEEAKEFRKNPTSENRAALHRRLWEAKPISTDGGTTTRETVAYASRDSRGALVVRHGKGKSWMNYYPMGVSHSERRKGMRVLVDGETPIRYPTLGTGPDGNMIAAYTKPSDKGGDVVELHDITTGRKTTVGLGSAPVFNPRIVTYDGRMEVAYTEGDEIKKTTVAPGLAVKKTTVLPKKHTGADRLLQARPAESGTATMVRVGKNEIRLAHADKELRFEGVAGDFLLLEKSIPMVAIKRANGAIAAKRGAEKPVELVPANPRNGPPALVRTKDGLRLYFHRRLRKETAEVHHTPESGGAFQINWSDGKWGEPERCLRAEEPVVEAAVVLNFDLKFRRAHYKLMNTSVFLNGKAIGKLPKRVPAGRYVFPVKPSLLRYRSNREAKSNQVNLRIQGIGRGNFHVIDQCHLYARHMLMQDRLVADNSQEASRLANLSSPEVRHGVFDLMVANNYWELPHGVKPGDTLTAVITLFNSGDRKSPAGKLTAVAEDTKLGSRSIPGIEPFSMRHFKMKIKMPEDWQKEEPLKVMIGANIKGDANPEDNELRIYALRDLTVSLAGPSKPARVNVAAIPSEQIETVDLVDKPVEVDLPKAKHWYRFPAPDKGQLHVELAGVPDDFVLSMDLFTEDGALVQAERGVWKIKGDHLLLRVGLRPNQKMPPDAVLKMEWKTK